MEPLSSVSNTAASASSAKTDAYSTLDSADFVKIIFTELSKQDPTKPNDSSALLQQLSSLRSIQSDIDLSKKLETIVAQDQLSAAGNLIGKVVSGLDDTDSRVQGVVTSVSRTKDGPILTLRSGERVALDKVDDMLDPALVAHAAPGPAAGAGGGS